MKLTDEQVKKKIDELTKAKAKETNKIKRRNIQKLLYHYYHYNERLARQYNKLREKQKQKAMRERTERDIDFSLEPGQFLSKLELDMWDCKRTDHIPLDADSFARYKG